MIGAGQSGVKIYNFCECFNLLISGKGIESPVPAGRLFGISEERTTVMGILQPVAG